MHHHQVSGTKIQWIPGSCCNPLTENASPNQHKSTNRVEICFNNSISPRTPAFRQGSLLNVVGSLSGVRYKDTSVLDLPKPLKILENHDFYKSIWQQHQKTTVFLNCLYKTLTWLKILLRKCQTKKCQPVQNNSGWNTLDLLISGSLTLGPDWAPDITRAKWTGTPGKGTRN